MRRPGWIAGLAALAAVLLCAPGAAAKKLPDLVIDQSDAHSGSQGYVVDGGRSVLRYRVVTANHGRGNAKPSATAISALPLRTGPGAEEIRGDSVRVAGLAGVFHGNYAADVGHVKSPITFEGQPVGSYEVALCADAKNAVRETNERNNCRSADTLYHVKRTWNGTVSGSAPVNVNPPGAARQSWVSHDAKLVLPKDDDLYAKFPYKFVGTVEWTVQGFDGRGCEWNGGGSAVVDETTTQNSAFDLDLDRGMYTGHVDAEPGISYPASRRCGATTTTEMVVLPALLDTTFRDDDGGPNAERPFDYGSQTMAGSGVDSLATTTWQWEFH